MEHALIISEDMFFAYLIFQKTHGKFFTGVNLVGPSVRGY